MRQIIIARHCETDLIASGDTSFRRNDSPLSARGRKQAAEIAKFVNANYKYDAVFTSLFLRAIDTAKIINSENKPQFSSMSLNEYFNGDDGKGRESTTMGVSRTMSFLYPLFDIYSSILIVAHNSINSTIIRSLLNNEYEEAESYFNKVGEVLVLRYDWKLGDKFWQIIDKFDPAQ